MAQLTVKNIVVEMWEEFEKQVENYGLVAGEIEEVIEFVPNKILQIGLGLIGLWNSKAEGGWATIGPRMLGPKFEKGVVRKIGRRTFLAPAPMASKTAIIIEKLDGKAGAEVEIKVHNRQGEVVQSRTLHFPTDSSTPTKRFEVDDRKSGIVSVEVDAKMPAWGIDKFEYRIKYEERPQVDDQGEVKGFADLHVHQTAGEAYLGSWLHGSHTGSPAQALEPCDARDHALPQLLWNAFNKAENASKVYHGKGYPSFEDWPHHLDMAHQQVHESWLSDAHKRGLSLIIACAVNNEPWAKIMSVLRPVESAGTIRDMPVLKNQIHHIHDFAKNHSWYQVALNPWHAREIIHAGNMAVVISVECSNLFPRDQGDYIEQLDELYQMGVRCLNIAHEVDSRFAGAALQERMLSVLETIKRMSHLDLELSDFLKHEIGFKKDENGRNEVGLTDDGEKLVNAIMDRHMLLDTSHLSARALQEVFEIALRRKRYPIINTHTKFHTILTNEERKVQREFCTFDDQIHMFIETGGIVGLRTAPWPNRQAPRPKGLSDPNDESEVVETDEGEIGTARSYAQQVTYAHDKGLAMAIGSDINGFTNQLGPRRDGARPPEVSEEYWKHGLRHIGLEPDLVRDLKALKTPGATTLAHSTELFLQSWARTWIRNLEDRKSPTAG
jgi:microsomal dipeptidase-like Zn-dependent dipeptidase